MTSLAERARDDLLGLARDPELFTLIERAEQGERGHLPYQFFPSLLTPCIEERAPLRVAIIDIVPMTVESAEVAIIVIGGDAGPRCFHWRRADLRIKFGEVTDRGTAAAPNRVPLHHLRGYGDARVAFANVMRVVQTPAPAWVGVQNQRYALVPEATLGRGSDPKQAISDIVFQDGRVSRVQWQFEWADGHWWIRTHGHTGNTELNRTRIFGRHVLADGDVFAAASFEVVFRTGTMDL